jgi:hypothetical protein
MMRLAEYQVRLLLCTPDQRSFRGGREHLAWHCGCLAVECGTKKYAVQPCESHGYLLMQVSEGEERPYDGISNGSFVTLTGRGSA